MFKKTPVFVGLILAVYTIINVVQTGGLMAYFFPSACWLLVGLIIISQSEFKDTNLWFNKKYAYLAAAVALIQIFILIDIGLITGFGKSPYSFSTMGIIINLIYVSTNLIGIEFSRAFILKNVKKKNIILLLCFRH